jgi:hypothetical protein
MKVNQLNAQAQQPEVWQSLLRPKTDRPAPPGQTVFSATAKHRAVTRLLIMI